MAASIIESVMVCSRHRGARDDSGTPHGGQRGLVERPGRRVAKLAHVPVGVGQREADHGDILADAGHFLRPPERKGVVVAVGEEDRVRRRAVEQVVGEVGGEAGVGAVPSTRPRSS